MLEFNLSTNKVSTTHIKNLQDQESKLELKVCYRLADEDLGETGHYEKMLNEKINLPSYLRGIAAVF